LQEKERWLQEKERWLQEKEKELRLEPQQPEESEPQQYEESEPQQPEESEPQQPEESEPQQPEESEPQQPEESEPQQAEESEPQQAENFQSAENTPCDLSRTEMKVYVKLYLEKLSEHSRECCGYSQQFKRAHDLCALGFRDNFSNWCKDNAYENDEDAANAYYNTVLAPLEEGLYANWSK
jgi:hypothetical protein